MTDEQQRTLAYFRERYERQVILKAHGAIRTLDGWRAYNEAVADFYGYRHWLHTRALTAKAAA